jgi:twinkle protein
MSNSSSTLVSHEACDVCRQQGNDTSGDNKAVYDDGHAYCFKCQTFFPGGKEKPVTTRPPKAWKPIRGQAFDLVDRGIDAKTCQFYGYIQAEMKNGQTAQIANYIRDGELVAQHARLPGKKFPWIGDTSKLPLWGQHLWRGGGKRLIITEGEIDALTVAQLQGLRWPVVSLPSGASSAVKHIRANLEFVLGYQQIVLCFDMDDPGQEAAKKVADLLPPGRVFIASLRLKDANEMAKEGAWSELNSALWEAKPYRPDGILHVSDVQADTKDEQEIWEFPFANLTEFLIGQRSGEITMWTSGTGSGKSTILRELINHHLQEGRSVGCIMLEESPEETVDDLIGLRLNKPVRQIKALRVLNGLRKTMGKDPVDTEIVDDLEETDYQAVRAEFNQTGLYIYDHFGNGAYDNLLQRIEYMAVSLGVKVVVLDHITAAVAGISSTDGDNERLVIDGLMKDLRSLVQRTGIHLDIVSQLRKSNGKGYEEGERITLQALRGSGSLGSVPNTIIAMERNRQDPDPIKATTSVLRVLKNRFSGRVGVASALHYETGTGRLDEVPFNVSADGEVYFEDNAPDMDLDSAVDDLLSG